MAIASVPAGRNDVHAESVRVGIRLAFQAHGQAIPSPEMIERILATARTQLNFHEFPLEVVSQQTLQRRDVRRMYAIKALEILLQKSDSGFGDENPHEKAVDQAWAIAAQMERHDNSGMMLDVVGEKTKGKR